MNDLITVARARAVAESRILREALPPAEPPRHVDLSYRVAVTCPRCGGPLQHVAAAAEPRGVSVETRAVASCAPCRDSFVIVVQLAGLDHMRRRETSIRTDRALHPVEVA